MARPSTPLFAAFLLVGAAWLFLFVAHPALSGSDHAQRRAKARHLVRRLGLTDLALVTEARHTRHPSQADRFAAFQNHPMALDPFPSGSVMAPPRPEGHGRH
jgi:hypothetical protein